MAELHRFKIQPMYDLCPCCDEIWLKTSFCDCCDCCAQCCDCAICPDCEEKKGCKCLCNYGSDDFAHEWGE